MINRSKFSVQPPLLHLPDRSDAAPNLSDRLSIYLIVFLPWLLAFEAVNLLGAPHDVHNGWAAADASMPMLPWTELIYFLDYPFVLALPLSVHYNRGLSRAHKENHGAHP